MIFSLLVAMSQVVASNPNEKADIAFCNSEEREWQTGYVCMAEQEFDRVDKQLNQQWAKTFRFVRQRNGQLAANRLRQRQRAWIKISVARCETESALTPSTQQARNYLGCLQVLTEKRTSELLAMVRHK